MSTYRVNSNGLWSGFSKQEKNIHLEKITKSYDFLLEYHFTKEFRAYRIASRFKRYRDQLRNNSPAGISFLLGKIFSQGIIIRISRMAAYTYPKKSNQDHEEIYNIFK